MRLLLIEQDKRSCADFRQRLANWRPEAEVLVRDPVVEGPLPPEFLAQGYDAVLLADEWSGGSGLTWAKELAARVGFAPLVLLSSRDSVAYEAIPLGVQVVGHDGYSFGKLIEVLTACEQRQSFARAVWRTSAAGRDAQRFGGAFGIAAVTAVFAANGHLGTAATFTAGFRPALLLAAALSFAGVITALAVGSRRLVSDSPRHLEPEVEVVEVAVTG